LNLEHVHYNTEAPVLARSVVRPKPAIRHNFPLYWSVRHDCR